jgi:hypothetical protein
MDHLSYSKSRCNQPRCLLQTRTSEAQGTDDSRTDTQRRKAKNHPHAEEDAYAGQTIKSVFGTDQLAMDLCPDPSVLVPPVAPWALLRKPQLMDYVQLPMHIWAPDYFFPDLVPFVPCPKGVKGQADNCDGYTKTVRGGRR